MAIAGELALLRQRNDADPHHLAFFTCPRTLNYLAAKLQSVSLMTTTTTQTTTQTASQQHVEFDDLLEVAPANDVYRCSPDDPMAGMALVRQIAASVARRLPSHVDRDELVSLGALGWVEAHARFDASRGVPFAGFAAMRIRGAILDGLRASDSLSRGDRKRAKADSEPTAPRIFCDEREVDAAVAGAADAAEILQNEELRQELRVALDTLPARDRYIVQRHFFDEVPMRALGIELGVTESRISQIVTATIGKLRQKFGIALLPRKRATPPRVAKTALSFAAQVAA
jgi:RNA polymerase sigma factor (sigma-70 family)